MMCRSRHRPQRIKEVLEKTRLTFVTAGALYWVAGTTLQRAKLGPGIVGPSDIRIVSDDEAGSSYATRLTDIVRQR